MRRRKNERVTTKLKSLEGTTLSRETQACRELSFPFVQRKMVERESCREEEEERKRACLVGEVKMEVRLRSCWWCLTFRFCGTVMCFLLFLFL